MKKNILYQSELLLRPSSFGIMPLDSLSDQFNWSAIKIQSVLVLLFIAFTTSSFSQNFDINTLKKINVQRNKNLDNSFIFITNSNNYVNYGAIGAFTITGIIKKDKKIIKQGMLLFSAQMSTAIITQGLKRIIRRDRPFEKYAFIEEYKLEKGFSFPSGHTSSAFANAMALSLINKKWYVVVPSFAYASAVGYSRLHLGVHYPTDVIAGAAIGIGSAYLNNWLIKKYNTKIDKKLKCFL